MGTTSGWVDLGAGRRGFFARPDGDAPCPAILVHVEAYGLNGHFQRLTERLAGEGFAVLTPDLHDGVVYGYDDLKSAVAHLRRMDEADVLARTEAGLAFLAAQPGVSGPAGVLGFCMGGRYAFLAGLALPERFGAIVAFYGGGIAPAADMFGRPPLLDRVEALRAPVALFYGSDDPVIRPDEHARIAERLSTHGKDYALHVFGGATHGFFCEDRVTYHPVAAERAWRLALAFLRERLAGVPHGDPRARAHAVSPR